MALKVHDTAPDFSLPSTNGQTFDYYKAMEGKPCIIYFYPKDFTRTCTTEACDFRDNMSFFNNFEIDVFGISRDKMETHLKFKEEHQLPFELLSDPSGNVCKAYKALVPLIGIPKRVTYLIDKDRKVRAVYENFFGAKQHIQEMITELNK
jgi:thioredoxin-dependent peroxiredoxin